MGNLSSDVSKMVVILMRSGSQPPPDPSIPPGGLASALARSASVPNFRLSRQNSLKQEVRKEILQELMRTSSTQGSDRGSDGAPLTRTKEEGECYFCLESEPQHLLYGAGLAYPKSCICPVVCCLRCLRRSVHDQTRKGLKPQCPAKVTEFNCEGPLDPALLALLSKGD